MARKKNHDYLGHEKASTTLDIYAHMIGDAQKETATQLEEMLKIDAC